MACKCLSRPTLRRAGSTFRCAAHGLLPASPSRVCDRASAQNIASVVNFDTAKSIDTHVHRCGRTGAAHARAPPLRARAPRWLVA